MKKTTQLLCVIFLNVVLFVFSSCSFFENNSNENKEAPLNPITYIDLENDDTAMLVGESFDLKYTITPSNTDEQVIISSGDSSIVEVQNNKVTAKKVGNSWISIKVPSDKSNIKSREVRIKVIESLDYNNFEKEYADSLEKATVSVFCKRYDKNWLGQEKNVYIVSGKGIIIKSAVYANYFLRVDY